MAGLTRTRWYLGVPGAGKTMLALGHLAQLTRERGVPALVVDSAGVGNFDALPRACSLDHALGSVFGLRRTCAYIPRDAADVDAIARAALSPGGIVLLVDEAEYWVTSARGRGGDLLRLLRAHRHARTDVLLTAQHLTGDVPQEAFSCAPVLHVFRCASPVVLDRLEREHGLDRQEVSSLPRLSYIVADSGFPA